MRHRSQRRGDARGGWRRCRQRRCTPRFGPGERCETGVRLHRSGWSDHGSIRHVLTDLGLGPEAGGRVPFSSLSRVPAGRRLSRSVQFQSAKSMPTRAGAVWMAAFSSVCYWRLRVGGPAGYARNSIRLVPARRESAIHSPIVCESRSKASATWAADQPSASSRTACQRSRSRGVGARYIRWPDHAPVQRPALQDVQHFVHPRTSRRAPVLRSLP
jgi:hypothetical protein